MKKIFFIGILCVVTLLMGCKKNDDPQPTDEYRKITLNSSATESKLTSEMLEGASKIKITGSMNAADFKVLRDHKELEYLNLAEATVVGPIIVGYKFNEITEKYERITVDGNAIPYGAFGMYDDFEPEGVKPGSSIGYAYFDDFTGNGKVIRPLSENADKSFLVEEHKRIKSIVFPGNITHIGRRAFHTCKTLTEPVEFPSTLRNIMDEAFAQCWKMKGELKFPAELNVIGNIAFQNCFSLTGTLTIPKNITIIYDMAFLECKGITELKMHDKVEVIGVSALAGMTGLTKLDLPKGLTGIDVSGFSGCSGLKGDLTLPETLEQVMDRVFFDCKNLDGTLTLNAGLSELGEFSFEGANFKTIIAKWTESENPIPAWDPINSFWFPENFQVSANKPQYVIYIPTGQLEYYKSIFSNKDGTPGFYNFKEGQPAN